MFVEIRHVETGSMSQVIQGNNLRCLCTDVPVLLRQAHPRHSQSSNSVGGGAHGNTQDPPAVYSLNGARSSLPATDRDAILTSPDRRPTVRLAVLPGD